MTEKKKQTVRYLETGKRGIVKLIIFRFYISISNIGFGWYLSGDWRAGLAYAGAATIVNSFMLWSYDRIWNRIQWGKVVEIEEVNEQ